MVMRPVYSKSFLEALDWCLCTMINYVQAEKDIKGFIRPQGPEHQ